MKNIIRFISWNVRGVGGPTKCDKIMTHLQQLKGDMFFIQETHLWNREVTRLKRGWVDHVFHSRFNERARGTAIMVRKNIMFEPGKVVSDLNGRFVIVAGKLQNTTVILASVYGPNWDDCSFISKLSTSLPNIYNHYIIISGDFNLVQDPILDRSSNKPQSSSKPAKTLHDFAKRLGLSDPWRHTSPMTKTFSFFSHVHHTYTRIDFFLLDDRLLSMIKASDYHSIAISDHTPTSLDLQAVEV